MIQHPGPWSALVTLPLPPTGETVRRVLHLEQTVLEWDQTLETLPAFNRLLVTGQPATWDPAGIRAKLEELVAHAISGPLPVTTMAEAITMPACYDPELALVRTWLTRMARNHSTDLIRREERSPLHNSISWAETHFEPVDSLDTELEVHYLLEVARVRQAVDSLKDVQKEALALAYFYGYSHREIAHLIDQPVGTIKGRIRAAMQQLRLLLVDEDNGNV